MGIVSAEANVGGALNGLVSMDGTSMACPPVAGLAALHWQAFKTGTRNPSTITPNLLSSCQVDAIEATQRDMTDIGRGLARAPHG
ncbi:S8 family serine peptidase [Rhizobium leguminosarum]|uniref:S8 family serine peptidase n=1 Tax=Rhizobium leguminosarum TaxID=384 RepID=UPI002479F09D|nr:S8 family serine peptidase [Rhizobium leguminosarum]